MGVHDLWNIIASSCDTISLSKLQGKTIAIDLSGWAVDSQCLVSANAAQPNMYLRNLFFRTMALLMQGTIPVFVLEGKPPELKKKVIAERLNLRDGQNRDAATKTSKCSRGRLNSILKDCERMLNLMGLTCVRADGEAEAMCAYLNEDGLVDGCITQDGDCFLYGAKTIYRKFALAGQAGTGRTAEEYSIEKIEKMYKIGRKKLIALALLCGCDYTPGVDGVGKSRVLKFFNQVDDSEVLRRMKSWKRDSTPAPTKEERSVQTKCLLVNDFPNQEVIDEFLIRKGSVPTKIDNWQYPNGARLTEFLSIRLTWEIDAAFDKVLPLVTRWQVINFRTIPQELRPKNTETLIPIEIKKIRNPQSVPSFEIEWTVQEASNYIEILAQIDEPRNPDKKFLTVEPQADVRQSYLQLVETFEELKAAKKKPASKKGKRGTTKEIGDNTGTPVKPKKTKSKKEQVSSKKLDDYFQQRKYTSSARSKRLEPEKKKKPIQPESSHHQQQREQLQKEDKKSKLDGTLKSIYDDLSPEDFASDVDADCAEMSMVIQRTCSQTNTILPTLLSLQSEILSYPDEKTRPPSPLDVVHEQPGIVDISSDDDIIYVPLGERIKAKR